MMAMISITIVTLVSPNPSTALKNIPPTEKRSIEGTITKNTLLAISVSSSALNMLKIVCGLIHRMEVRIKTPIKLMTIIFFIVGKMSFNLFSAAKVLT